MKRISIVGAVVLVGGFIASIVQAQSLPNAALAAQHDAQCQSYGAAVGSDAYVNCRTALATQADQAAAAQKQQAAANAEARRQRLSAALMQMSRSVSPPPLPTYQIVQPKPSTTCRSNAFGGTLTAECR